MARITVKADISSLDTVIDFVQGILELAECSMKLINSVNLVIEEVFVNIAHYAYEQNEGNAEIECVIDGGVLTVVFQDFGVPYNPLLHEDPDVTQSLENRAVGGLGILLVKRIMDEQEYARIDGANRFTLRKKL